MNKQLATSTTTTNTPARQCGILAAGIALVATVGLTVGIASTGHAQVDDVQPGPAGYTVLDHPAKPCNLSVEAVANWGETSAHLPQACTYDD